MIYYRLGTRALPISQKKLRVNNVLVGNPSAEDTIVFVLVTVNSVVKLVSAKDVKILLMIQKKYPGRDKVVLVLE